MSDELDFCLFWAMSSRYKNNNNNNNIDLELDPKCVCSKKEMLNVATKLRCDSKNIYKMTCMYCMLDLQ